MKKYIERVLHPTAAVNDIHRLREKKHGALYQFFMCMYLRILAPGLNAARAKLLLHGIAIHAQLPTMSMGRFRQRVILLYAKPARAAMLVITSIGRMTLRLRGGEVRGRGDGTVLELPLAIATEEQVSKAVAVVALALRNVA